NRLGTQSVGEARYPLPQVLCCGGEGSCGHLVTSISLGDDVRDRGSYRAVFIAHQPVIPGDRRALRRKRFPASLSPAGAQFAVRLDAHVPETAHTDPRPYVKLAIDDQPAPKTVDDEDVEQSLHLDLIQRA